jgi:hypothetical protein
MLAVAVVTLTLQQVAQVAWVAVELVVITLAAVLMQLFMVLAAAVLNVTAQLQGLDTKV